MNRRALVGKPPRQKRAAVHRVLEPGVEFVRNVAVQEDLDDLFLLAGELANLQIADVGRGLPIHVARALEGLVRADAIEVAAQPAIVRFDFTRDSGQQIVESGLRIDRRDTPPFRGVNVTRAVFSRKPNGKEVEKAKPFCR